MSTPEDQQIAADLFTQLLVDGGLDEDEAQDFVADVTEEASTEQES